MPRYNNTVVIGGIDLQDFAIPEFVKYGGPQQIDVKFQPGGARQIDVMGDNPSPIEWSGLILQTDALQVANALLTMKTAGEPVVASWSGGPNFHGFAQLVVVEDVTFQFRANAMIEYHIKCIPVINGDNTPEGLQGNGPPGANGAAGLPGAVGG